MPLPRRQKASQSHPRSSGASQRSRPQQMGKERQRKRVDEQASGCLVYRSKFGEMQKG